MAFIRMIYSIIIIISRMFYTSEANNIIDEEIS